MPDRVDFYAPVHKAYRAFMSDTLVRLGRIDLDDPCDTDAALRQVAALLASTRHHIRHEDAFMHPPIVATGRAPASLAQHGDHLAEIAALEALVEAVERCPRAGRDALAHQLYHRLSAFVAGNLEHMLGEEIDNNAVLWAHYTDAQITAVHDALIDSIEPPVFMEVMAWMLPALTPRELAQVMQGTRAGAPAPVFDALMALAADRLPHARYERLEADLGVAA